jgi:xylose isomerase
MVFKNYVCRAYEAMKKDGILEKMKKERYSSYQTGLGAKIAKGKTSFEELEKHVLKGESPKQVSFTSLK